MRRSPITSRKRIRLLAILSLATVAAVAAAIVELTSVIRGDVARSLMRRAADQAETAFRVQLDKLFDPLQMKLAIVERWGERGSLDLGDHRRLNDLFVPTMEQLPWATAMMIATEEGLEYMLLREDSTWVTRATDEGGQPGWVGWRRWTAGSELLSEWQEELDYDPRRRPWYEAAVEGRNVDERGIAWTGPYRFFTTQQIGVTLSKKWRTEGAGGITHVTAIDVPLESIIGITQDRIGARDGLSFVVNRDQRVFDSVGAGDESGLRTATQLELDFLDGWRKSGLKEEAPFSVLSGGARWWVDFRTVSDDSTRLWLAVGVPDSSLAGEVRGRQHQLALVVLGVLLVGVLLTIVATQARVASPAGGLDLRDEAALQDLFAGGEGERLEFKSTLRWNVNANKPGKEVEMSWLKTVVAFLNSDGGVLLIGVNDDGEPVGIEADHFANDDKFLLHYNNRFKQHIGLEFKEYVRADFATLRNRKVFVIQCERSSRPVYLKSGNEEKYYVRVGPSSRALSTSQVVEHVRRRR